MKLYLDKPPIQVKLSTFIAGLVLTLLAGLGAVPLYNQVAVQGISIEPEEAAFITLLNDYRRQNGLAPVTVDSKLQQAAEARSQDMADHNYFSHTSSTGENPFDFMCRVADYCYNVYKGENIGAGYTSGSAVFTGWRTSPGHNANMLGPNYAATGIARVSCTACTYGYYWTSLFGGIVSAPFGTPTVTPNAVPTLAPPIVTTVPTVTAVPRACLGDFDNNRVVDARDLAFFFPVYNTAVTMLTEKFDFNRNGLINGQDTAAWFKRLGACPL